jgi:hypothetical protein
VAIAGTIVLRDIDDPQRRLPQPQQHVAQHPTDLLRVGHVVGLIDGASVVLIVSRRLCPPLPRW